MTTSNPNRSPKEALCDDTDIPQISVQLSLASMSVPAVLTDAPKSESASQRDSMSPGINQELLGTIAGNIRVLGSKR